MSQDPRLIELLQEVQPNQRDFLLARQHTDSDAQACDAANVSRSSVPRWKKQPLFAEAYGLLITPVPDAEELAKEIAVADRGEIVNLVRDQMGSYAQRLPQVFERLFSIVQFGGDKDALKAIEVIGKWFGIAPDAMRPEQLSRTQKNILSWTQININRGDGGAEDAERDRGEAEIEGAFVRLPPE